MKLNRTLFLIAILSAFFFSCNAQTKEQASSQQLKTSSVEVYYFHYTRRCATCYAVENVSKEVVKELYGGKVNFSEYNLEEPEGEMKGIDLKVSGQTLLIVSGDTKIDITNEGFLNAQSNPDKLKQIIKEKIDPLL